MDLTDHVVVVTGSTSAPQGVPATLVIRAYGVGQARFLHD